VSAVSDVAAVPLVHDEPLTGVPPEVLYGILRLRSEVFVVEQACVYLDPDGRDAEPGARLLWITDGDGAVVATARVLDDGGARRIGRIATTPTRRSEGLAARLVDHFLATATGPWRLDAQVQLAGWYERFGFTVDGPEYDDDGIMHVPMVRPVPG
jgi:ElaA protein